MLEQANDRHHMLQDRRNGQHDLDALSARPGVLSDINQAMNRRLSVYLAASQAATAEKLGLSVTELKALELVLELGQLPTGQLAQLMGISWGGATALISRLETAGYITRSRHPLDRRVIVIRPLKEKCREIADAQQALADEVTFTSRQFNADQLNTIQAFLTQYTRALKHETVTWLNARSSTEAWND